MAPGERPARYAAHAVAAVIVQTSTARAQPDLSLFARAFGLTRAETDLLGRLVGGDDITMAGVALGIAKTTAKTHLARLYSKTGTNRQSVLVVLANKLVTARSDGTSCEPQPLTPLPQSSRDRWVQGG